MKRFIAFASWLCTSSLLVGGCAHTTPEQAQAERAQAERCARVEIYPMGVTPPRPYRVIGPVSSEQNNAASRNRDLQDKACAIGADAIVDVTEQHPVPENGLGTAPATRDGATTAGGLAIAFTDGAAPAATP
jgi:hypothetical protein